MASEFPRQQWVTGVCAAEFDAEANRQSAAVAASGSAADDLAYIDALSVDVFS